MIHREVENELLFRVNRCREAIKTNFYLKLLYP